MFKAIDGEDSNVEGFCYKDKFGDAEYVKFDSMGDASVILTGGDNEIHVYLSDIPKLIKALQMAYDYKQEK